ncbi:fluoride efflux transporter CrcB [Roseospirillum parvum]|uniref:Fluoride-specific ion channel FluC n=1 Tax=Roseospirillum parvum TaxID=83401 RepID=A0A1G7ZAL0_9PROT|nr:fluoride efflux transporter CrcB [Roseospirillum parvum]SDH05792.1 CrcB protein [Roseospirillum parvum]
MSPSPSQFAPQVLAAVAVGGAGGAVCRYVLSVLVTRLFGHGFPWGTLAVNLLGALLMGMLIEAAALRWSLGPLPRALLVVGFLGGFTTFSTLSLDMVTLIERQQVVLAVVYATVSVGLGVAALFGGLSLVRWLLG